RKAGGVIVAECRYEVPRAGDDLVGHVLGQGVDHRPSSLRLTAARRARSALIWSISPTFVTISATSWAIEFACQSSRYCKRSIRSASPSRVRSATAARRPPELEPDPPGHPHRLRRRPGPIIVLAKYLGHRSVPKPE